MINIILYKHLSMYISQSKLVKLWYNLNNMCIYIYTYIYTYIYI